MSFNLLFYFIRTNWKLSQQNVSLFAAVVVAVAGSSDDKKDNKSGSITGQK